MTSFAFIAGCLPLVLASGSGAVARQVMGTAVVGGMLAASAIAIFLIPASYCVSEEFAAFVRRTIFRKKVASVVKLDPQSGRQGL
jgi:Cu/Ag efflux pump CusA